MGKRARVYTGIYRYFTIPVFTLRNTPAAIVYQDRSAAHFPKARKLKLMIDHGKPSAAAAAAYKLIKD